MGGENWEPKVEAGGENREPKVGAGGENWEPKVGVGGGNREPKVGEGGKKSDKKNLYKMSKVGRKFGYKSNLTIEYIAVWKCLDITAVLYQVWTPILRVGRRAQK